MSDFTYWEIQSQLTLTFIVAAMVFGVIRLLLRTRFDYDADSSRFPTRSHVSHFMIGLVLLFPYVEWPLSDHVWNYVRIFDVVYYPMGFMMGFIIFSGESARWRKACAASTVASLSIVAVTLGILLTHNGHLLVDHWPLFATIGGTVGAAETALMMALTLRVEKNFVRYNVAVYSNQDDFYYQRTRMLVFYPAVWMAVMWVMFFTGSRMVAAVSALPLITSMIVIVAKIMLHLNEMKLRKVNDSQNADTDQQDDANDTSDVETSDFSQEVQAEVIAVISRRYLEPSLTRTDVIADISYGRKTDAGRLITQIGFYELVNMFRLKHAQLYRLSYPNATQDAVASASGFTSRFALNRALKRNIDINSPLLDGFNPTIVM